MLAQQVEQPWAAIERACKAARDACSSSGSPELRMQGRAQTGPSSTTERSQALAQMSPPTPSSWWTAVRACALLLYACDGQSDMLQGLPSSPRCLFQAARSEISFGSSLLPCRPLYFLGCVTPRCTAVHHDAPPCSMMLRLAEEGQRAGGQYDCGTTDVTRTFHLGTPTDHQRLCFTRVLQVSSSGLSVCAHPHVSLLACQPARHLLGASLSGLQSSSTSASSAWTRAVRLGWRQCWSHLPWGPRSALQLAGCCSTRLKHSLCVQGAHSTGHGSVPRGHARALTRHSGTSPSVGHGPQLPPRHGARRGRSPQCA